MDDGATRVIGINHWRVADEQALQFTHCLLIRARLRGMHDTARADQHAQEENSEKLRK